MQTLETGCFVFGTCTVFSVLTVKKVYIKCCDNYFIVHQFKCFNCHSIGVTIRTKIKLETKVTVGKFFA